MHVASVHIVYYACAMNSRLFTTDTVVTGSSVVPVEDAGISVERIERFQALEPGAYWRFVGPREEDDWVEIGLVLLLLDVELFDGKPHTIKLAGHPLHRSGSSKWLVDDFLARWEFAEDGEQVRLRELASLQAEVGELQAELLAGQTNPEVLAPVVAKGLAEWEARRIQDAGSKQRKLGKASAAATESAKASSVTVPTTTSGRLRTDVGFIVDQRMSAEDVAKLRVTVEREAAIAEIKTTWIRERIDGLSSKIKAMTPFFEERSAVALAKTSSVRKYAEELMQGIASLDLYTGKGVELETLVTGEPAGREHPLAILQRKLFMDEELAAWADVDAAFDFRSIKEFDAAIAANAALRDQILPLPRCVVSMAVRRGNLDYGDAWRNERENEINRQVFLLVRNGENVHRVYSAAKSHEHAEVLFPRRNETDHLFTGFGGEEITFSDLRFTDRADAAAREALHYKRFLILLCGLDHRLELFGDFYDRADAMSFISREFQSKYLQFVADAEPGSLLGEGRPPWQEYALERNLEVQSGSRVLCYHSTLISPATAPACERWSEGRHRVTVTLASPVADSEILVAFRDGKDICVSARVKRDSWRDLVQPYFDARISLTESAQAQARSQVVGFLCLDRVRADDLHWYVHNRASRVAHVDFIRIFKRTLEQLRTEEVQEAPARAYLRSTALTAKVGREATIDAVIDDSVRAWRCAHRGAALPAAGDVKALGTVLNLIYSMGGNDDQVAVRLEAYAKARGLVPLRSVLTGKHRYGLYVETPAAERNEALGPWRHVTRLSLTATKRDFQLTSTRNAWLRDIDDPKEKEIQRWPAFAAWVNEGPEQHSVKAILAAIALVDAGLADVARFCAPGGVDPELFDSCLRTFRQALAKGRRTVPDIDVAIPIATYIHPGRHAGDPGVLAFLAVRASLARWLHHFGNEVQRAKVLEVIGGAYARKDVGRQRVVGKFAPRLTNAVGLTTPFSFDPDFRSSDALRMAESHERKGKNIEWGQTRHRSLDETFTRWVNNVCPPGKQDDGHYRVAAAHISALALTPARTSNLQALLRVIPDVGEKDDD